MNIYFNKVKFHPLDVLGINLTQENDNVDHIICL